MCNTSKNKYLAMIKETKPDYIYTQNKCALKKMEKIESKDGCPFGELDTLSFLNGIIRYKLLSLPSIRTYLFHIDKYKQWLIDEYYKSDSKKQESIEKSRTHISLTYENDKLKEVDGLTLRDTDYIKRIDEVMIYSLGGLIEILRSIFPIKSSAVSLNSISRDEIAIIYYCLIYLGIKPAEVLKIKLRDVKEDANGRISILHNDDIIFIPNELQEIMLKAIYANDCVSLNRYKKNHSFISVPIGNTENLLNFGEHYTPILMSYIIREMTAVQIKTYKNPSIKKLLYSNNLYYIGRMYSYNMYIKKKGIICSREGILQYMNECCKVFPKNDILTQLKIFQILLDKNMDYSNIDEYNTKFEKDKFDLINGSNKSLVDNDMVKINTEQIKQTKGYDDLTDDFKEFIENENGKDSLFHVKVLQIYVINFKAYYVALKEVPSYRFIQTDLIKVIK